jgi:hypothetical protein
MRRSLGLEQSANFSPPAMRSMLHRAKNRVDSKGESGFVLGKGLFLLFFCIIYEWKQYVTISRFSSGLTRR